MFRNSRAQYTGVVFGCRHQHCLGSRNILERNWNSVCRVLHPFFRTWCSHCIDVSMEISVHGTIDGDWANQDRDGTEKLQKYFLGPSVKCMQPWAHEMLRADFQHSWQENIFKCFVYFVHSSLRVTQNWNLAPLAPQGPILINLYGSLTQIIEIVGTTKFAWYFGHRALGTYKFPVPWSKFPVPKHWPKGKNDAYAKDNAKVVSYSTKSSTK